jgi:hypothetical protein
VALLRRGERGRSVAAHLHLAHISAAPVAGDTALHYAAGPRKGHIDSTRILLKAGAGIDLDNVSGETPAKDALLHKHCTTLELLLRHGADAHRAAVLPKWAGDEWSGEESKVINRICVALEEQPSVVHLLADHGGICEQGELDFHVACDGSTKALCALRQVGVSAWCSGCGGILKLRADHSIDGKKMLGTELVGHTMQIRLRLWQLAMSDAPFDLTIGSRVVLHSLTRTARTASTALSPARSGRRRRGATRFGFGAGRKACRSRRATSGRSWIRGAR